MLPAWLIEELEREQLRRDPGSSEGPRITVEDVIHIPRPEEPMGSPEEDGVVDFRIRCGSTLI